MRLFIDQGAHFFVALLALSLAIRGGPVGGAIAGFLCGMIREVAEAGNPVTLDKILQAPIKSDAPLDLVFWSLGGLIAAVIVI